MSVLEAIARTSDTDIKKLDKIVGISRNINPENGELENNFVPRMIKREVE